jgi:hypothetical protein
MSLKVRRFHFSGISNLDFRTKGDIDRIKFYEPFHESKTFGTQGLSNYKLPSPVHNELFSPTKGLNEGKFVKNEMPNPKIYETALFYKNNHIKIKPKIFLKVQRSKQLDTSEYSGGQEYNGDSMMISEINKKRKEIKIKEKLERENIKKRFNGNMYEDMKFNKINDNNKGLYLSSTDKKIQKSKSDICLDKKINKERLNMIKKKLFNRLKTHNDTKGIFIKWQNDYLNNTELSLYDLHKIINDLGIPITYNETFALISSANKRNTDKLNYDEFKNLFLQNDNNIDIDLSKIPFRKETLFKEKQKEEEQNKMKQYKNIAIQKSESFLKLKRLTRNNYPNFLQAMSKSSNNVNSDGNCNLPTFKKIIKNMKIPDKCKNDEVIDTIYDKYKSPETNLMNYKNYIEDCKNLKEENDFFHFQKGYLGLIKNKLEKNKEERNKFNEVLQENDRRKKSYLQNQLASMRGYMRKNNSDTSLISKSDNPSENIYSSYLDINKEKKYSLEKQNNQNNTDIFDKENNLENCLNNNNMNAFYNHYQPSLNFINYVFKDNKIYNDRYYKSIEEISPLIQTKNNSNDDLLKKNFSELDQKKYESLANSRKFNRQFLSSEIDDDKKRFRIFDISKDEKNNKLKYLENSLKRKFETNRVWNDKIDFQQKISDINNSLGQIKRTENLLRYEKKIQDMNYII